MAEPETNTGTSRIVFINSEDARKQGGNLTLPGESFTTTDYRIVLQQPIVVPAHHSIVMSTHHTSIPYTFYNFRKGINTILRFSITNPGVNGSTAALHTIHITPGNYNVLTMITQITDKLNAHASFVGTLHIRFNPDTNKYEWRYNAPAGGRILTFRLTEGGVSGADFEDDISAEIGFDSMKWVAKRDVIQDVFFQDDGLGNANSFTFGTSFGGGTPGANTFATSTSTSYFWNGDFTQGVAEPFENFFSSVDMMANNHNLFVRTNITSHSVQDSTTNGAFSSILAKIPVSNSLTGRGGMITLDPTDGAVHQLLLKVKVIDAIHIRLTDRKNRLIDLNGLDWNISLQFDFIETPVVKVPIDKRLEIEQKLYEEFKKSKEQNKK